MNTIKEINRINDREIELGHVGGMGPSWHDDWKDSAYVFIGGLPYELTEGDVITVFSQFGEVVDLHMPRDKDTGKPKGFAFLMYEDQRSTILAVDNMNGGKVLDRVVRVDHTRYKQQQTKNEEGDWIDPEQPSMNAMPKMIGGSDDGTASGEDDDEEDPMAAYLKAEKKREREEGGGDAESSKQSKKESKEEKKARKEAKREKKAKKEMEKMQKKFEEDWKKEMAAGEEAPQRSGQRGAERSRDGGRDRSGDRARVKAEERSPVRDGRRERSRSPPRHRDDRRGERSHDDRNRDRDRDRPRHGGDRDRGYDEASSRPGGSSSHSRRSPRPDRDDWRDARMETRRGFEDEADEDRDRRRDGYKQRSEAQRVMRKLDSKAGERDRNGWEGR